MKPKRVNHNQGSLLETRLSELLDPQNRLRLLADLIEQPVRINMGKLDAYFTIAKHRHTSEKNFLVRYSLENWFLRTEIIEPLD